MKVSTPDNPKPPTPLKVLLMGPPGSRKTTLGLQWPSVHVLDCDRNLDGPEAWLRSNGHKDLNYSYDPIRYQDDGSPREIHECYDAVIDALKRLVPGRTPELSNVKTVFCDSLSHVNEFIIRKILNNKRKESMEPHHWTDFKSYAYSLLVSRLEETNRTILCSCHEIKITQPDPKQITVQTLVDVEPFFQGKVGDTIGAFFTDIWRLDKRDASGGKTDLYLQTDVAPKCSFLKNSLQLPPEILLKDGFKTLEPYLRGRL